MWRIPDYGVDVTPVKAKEEEGGLRLCRKSLQCSSKNSSARPIDVFHEWPLISASIMHYCGLRVVKKCGLGTNSMVDTDKQ